MSVEGGAGDSEKCFAQGFTLGGVCMNELCGSVGRDAEVVEDLAFADEFAHSVTDHVNAQDGAVGCGDDFDCPCSLEDLAAGIAGDKITGAAAKIKLDKQKDKKDTKDKKETKDNKCGGG